MDPGHVVRKNEIGGDGDLEKWRYVLFGVCEVAMQEEVDEGEMVKVKDLLEMAKRDDCYWVYQS